MKKLLAAVIILSTVSALSTRAAEAKGNWDDNCAKCHGADGKGDTKMGHKLRIGDLTDAQVQAKFTDDEAFKALKEGLKDSEGRTRMKAFDDLSDAELHDLVTYVRHLKQ